MKMTPSTRTQAPARNGSWRIAAAQAAGTDAGSRTHDGCLYH